jgi:hypothetical protein
VLQFRLEDVEVHPVDAFYFEGNVLLQDIGNRSWYTHHWLWLTSIPSGSPPHRGKKGGCFGRPSHRLNRSLFY